MKTIISKYFKIKCLISIVLAFFMTAGHCIAFSYTCNVPVQTIILFPIRTIIVFFVLSFLYHLFDFCRPHKAKYNLNLIYLASFLLLSCFYIIEFLALYPGIFAYDAPYQLVMYLTDTISEWHPALHTYILGKIIELSFTCGLDVIAGIAVYTIVQFTVVALCFSYVLRLVYAKSGSIILWLVSIVFLGCFPTISLETMTASKDTFFMGFFVLSIALTIELLSDVESFKKSRIKCIFWVISALGMIIFRNNCIYAIPVLFILLICVSEKKFFVIKLIIAVLIGFVLYKTAFVGAVVKAEENGVETLSLPAQQLTKIYLDPDSDISDGERMIIERLIGEDGRTHFIPSSADVVKGAVDVAFYRQYKKEIKKLWLDLVLRNPGKATRAFADLTCGFWYPVYDLTFLNNGEKAYWCVYSLSPYYIESRIPGLLKLYLFFNHTDFSDLKMIPVYLIFAPATFFYIFIIMLGYALARKNKAFISVFIYTFAYWGTFLFGPVALVRYTTYMFAMLPLYFVLISNKTDKVEEIPDIFKNKNKICDLASGAAVFLLSFIFSLQSNSNIFVYREQGVDSAVFQYVAKMMMKGYLPYRDTFDHKGPLLYFINLAGMLINEKWGIWLIELIFLTVSFSFMYKSFRLWCGRAFSILILMFSFVPMSKFFYGGNYSEEYSITFIAISLYIFLDYFKNNKVNNLRLILCGLTFMATFLLRPNNAGMWVAMILCVLIKLFKEKDFKPLVRFILLFTAGCVICAAPFMIWLLSKGIFNDFYDCFVSFNTLYTETGFLDRVKSFAAFLKYYPVIISVIICLYFNFRRKSLHALGYLFLIMLNLVFVAISGDTYVHYGLILVPVIMLPYAVLFSNLKCEEKSLFRYVIYTLAVVSCTFAIISAPVYLDVFYDVAHAGEEYYPEGYAYVEAYTDYYTDKDDRVLYFGNCNRYYLLTDRLACSKYSYQSPIFDVSRDLGWPDEFFEELDEAPPKLIGVLTPAAYICDRDRMEEFLSEHDYQMILVTDDISLYVYGENNNEEK